MSKTKEEGKEKEKVKDDEKMRSPSTALTEERLEDIVYTGEQRKALTVPSDEVLNNVKKQLEAINAELSFDKYDEVYSVTPNRLTCYIKRYLSDLIVILKSPDAKFVTRMDLKKIVTKDHIENFVKQLKDTNVTALDLTGNDLKDEGAEALVNTLKEEGNKITNLNLRNNEIGEKGAKALANALKEEGNKITNLNLMVNKLKDEGARAIAEAIKHSNVTELYLSYNLITMKGAKALAEALKNDWKPTTLYLSSNNIGDEGAEALAEALEKKDSAIKELSINNNNIGGKGIKALTEKVPQGIVHIDFQNPLLTSSTASTTTTSVSTTSSFEKPSVDEKLWKHLITSDSMLELLSTAPQKAYEKLSTEYEFDAGMFIQLITRAEISSNGKLAFKDSKYLIDLVKKSSFNVNDPMLLAYAVRLSNEELALSVTKELVSKGAKITSNILYHSYYNPHLTKFLLIEKPSIITCQDKTAGIDSVIKKVQDKLSILKSKKDKDNVEMTLKLLEAVKTGGDDLNIKLDIICPPIFDNDYSKALFKRYSDTYNSYGKEGFNLHNRKSAEGIYEDIKDMIRYGGNLKGVSQEFKNYVHKISPAEIVKLLEPVISQDVSSTALTTTTSFSTTSSFEKAFDSSSSSTTPSLSSSTSSSGDDTVTTSSSSFSHQSLVTEGIPESADSAIPLTGESATVDAA